MESQDVFSSFVSLSSDDEFDDDDGFYNLDDDDNSDGDDIDSTSDPISVNISNFMKIRPRFISKRHYRYLGHYFKAADKYYDDWIDAYFGATTIEGQPNWHLHGRPRHIQLRVNEFILFFQVFKLIHLTTSPIFFYASSKHLQTFSSFFFFT